MKLLVMAHSGEAQSFFKEYKLSEQTQIMPFLYKTENFYLLICGEGRQNTTQRLSYCLGALKDEVTSVVNMGIAGSLDDSIELGEIVTIRTCYQEADNLQMEFKSFSTLNEGHDLVTANNRVLDSKQATHLSHFGTVVDREAWSIGSTCHTFKIPWSVYKLISDKAGHEKEICQRLKEDAYNYSNQLLKYYEEHLSAQQLAPSKIRYKLPFDLYLTKTQERQLTQLLKKLIGKYDTVDSILTKFDSKTILDSNLKPKEKSKRVIEELKQLLTPFNTIIKNELEDIITPLNNKNVSFKIDPQFEKKEIELYASISSQADIYAIEKSLKQLDLIRIQKVLSGDVDV